MSQNTANLYVRIIAEANRRPEPAIGWAFFGSVLVAYVSGDTGSVVDQGRRSVEIAEQLDNELSRVVGYFALGMAYMIDGKNAAARDTLRKSAATAIGRPTMLGWLRYILAVLAQAHLALGARTEALTAARDGIDRGRNGGGRYNEAAAQIELDRRHRPRRAPADGDRGGIVGRELVNGPLAGQTEGRPACTLAGTSRMATEAVSR